VRLSLRAAAMFPARFADAAGIWTKSGDLFERDFSGARQAASNRQGGLQKIDMPEAGDCLSSSDCKIESGLEREAEWDRFCCLFEKAGAFGQS
jgi:hypothetical protein